MRDTELAKAVAFFREKFGSDPTVAAFAPGRVNLIGEHVDYNGGFVLPFALPYRTIIVGALAPADAKMSTVVSGGSNLPAASFEIDSSLSKGEPEWANYIKGSIFQYLAELPEGLKLNAVVVSNVPMGAGLSSSAALEVAMATFLEGLCGITSVTGVQKALRCQKAEHTFADTPCGIMDQYISALGQEGNLLLLDCRSNEASLVPFGLDGPVVLVTNSNVKHTLSGSEYPDRVRQCQEAVAIFQTRYPQVTALRDATGDMLEAVRAQMSEVVYNRALHCISEDTRTLAAVAALKRGDFETVGRLMTESHTSLQNLYEVSCPELDLLVKIATSCPGVYGSRMTGGGFGGCTVTLVRPSDVAALKATLQESYFKQANLHCICYEAKPAAGAGLLDL